MTSRTINQIYSKCITTEKEKEKGQSCIQVKGMTRGIHVFNTSRIEDEFNRILSAVTKLPKSMRYSSSPEGKAWITARSGNGPLSGMSLLTTERLMAMAIALKIIRIVPHAELPCDIPFVVIDDTRLHRQEMTMPRSQRHWALVKWRVYAT